MLIIERTLFNNCVILHAQQIQEIVMSVRLGFIDSDSAERRSSHMATLIGAGIIASVEREENKVTVAYHPGCEHLAEGLLAAAKDDPHVVDAQPL